MVLPGSVHLPHLKSLKLQSFSFDNEDLTNEFFAQCPSLEFLGLILCKFLHLNVRISCPNLKHIEIFRPTEICMNGLHSDSGKVTLCAPNLSYFKTNDYMSTDYSLQNLSSIVIADILVTSVRKNEDAPELPVGVKELFAKRMIHFLRAVHNVKVLKLSYSSLEV
ncbi:putative F-box/LRR-repeat protein At3g59160 [Papaver somniferum]|uniref:putative F-box/LRR-repeat protein At3g59160 n=1 Tax=Papaver somniferum TaxID=3469 RepID=UPI000E6FA28E|nr:putative F-box/LRR-repeat protein At3g59160 [Papaver somniferum]